MTIPEGRVWITAGSWLYLPDPLEDLKWVTEGPYPQENGTWMLSAHPAGSPPQALAEALVSGLQGCPDICLSSLGIRAVELLWTDGFRYLRTWFVDLGYATVELVLVSLERYPLRWTDSEQLDQAKQLVDGLEQVPA